MKKIVPIVKESLKLNEVSPGHFKIGGKPYYAKVFSELYDRDWETSLCFVNTKDGIQEAEDFARTYQDLVGVGFYPPGTQFIVAMDELNALTVMALMPELEPAEHYPCLEKEILRLRKKAAKVLGVKKNELGSDAKDSSNYGLLEGKLYCFDFHVLDFHKILKNGQKYRDMPWV